MRERKKTLRSANPENSEKVKKIFEDLGESRKVWLSGYLIRKADVTIDDFFCLSPNLS